MKNYVAPHKSASIGEGDWTVAQVAGKAACSYTASCFALVLTTGVLCVLLAGCAQHSIRAVSRAGGSAPLSHTTFLQAESGATTRIVAGKDGPFIDAKDYGAKCVNNQADAQADTEALNTAHAQAKALRKILRFSGQCVVTEAAPGAGYAILNPGISIEGEPSLESQIIPANTIPKGTTLYMVRPQSAVENLSFIELNNITINPNHAALGGTGFLFLTDQLGSHVPALKISHMYIGKGAPGFYSFRLENPIIDNLITTTANSSAATVSTARGLVQGMYVGSGNVEANSTIDSISGRNLNLSRPARATGTAVATYSYNIQGNPSNSVIELSHFYNGASFIGIGDSVTIRNSVFRGDNECAITYNTDTSGVAANLVFEDPNMDCKKGIRVVRGSSPQIRRGNIELSDGSGSNGAVVDIDGSSGEISGPIIEGTRIGIFGRASATCAIRIHGARSAFLDNLFLSAGSSTPCGICITSSSRDTVVGAKIFYEGFTNNVCNDAPYRQITSTVQSR